MADIWIQVLSTCDRYVMISLIDKINIQCSPYNNLSSKLTKQVEVYLTLLNLPLNYYGEKLPLYCKASQKCS